MIWTVSVISLAGVTCHWTSFISHQNFSGWVNLFRCQASIFWTNRIDMGKISSREFHVKSAWKDEKSHHNLFSGEFLMKNVTCKCHVQIHVKVFCILRLSHAKYLSWIACEKGCRITWKGPSHDFFHGNNPCTFYMKFTW